LLSIAIAAVASLYALEYVYYLGDPNPAAFDYQYSDKQILVSYDGITYPASAVELSLLPANFHYRGKAPWEGRAAVEPDFVTDITTNEWGFFSDVSYQELVKHAPREFRILVVGGSGAQGHGASNLPSTFSCILESKLNADSGIKQSGYRVRVINLAIAGYYAETNYLVLHKFGRELNPDMILFYNGANDLAQLTLSTMPAFMERYVEGCLNNRFAWNESGTSPDYVKFLNDRFPYIGRKHRIFHMLGQRLTPAHYEAERRRLRVEFLHRWGLLETDDPNDKRVVRTLAFLDNKRLVGLPGHSRQTTGIGDIGEKMYRELALASFVESVKSVKRDFQGVPIVVAWQALGSIATGPEADAPRVRNSLLYDNWFDIDNVYERFYGEQQEALQGYMNDDWWFIYTDERINERRAAGTVELKESSIAVHLDDLGHKLVADILHDELLDVVEERLAAKAGDDHDRVRAAEAEASKKIR
jgi:hypothetical protein